MTFSEWLKTARITDTPQGDFIDDARSDSHFPNVQTWDQLDNYLLSRGACREAKEAAKLVWRRYLSRASRLAI
jgi:hypothetical protein